MGRVHTALVKSGQWSDQPGTVARPVVRRPPVSNKPSNTAALEVEKSQQRRYPAPVLVPAGPKLVEPAESAPQTVQSPVEQTDRRTLEIEPVVVEPVMPSVLSPVSSNVARLSRVARQREHSEPGANRESEESFLEGCPIVRVGALNMDPRMAALGQQGGLAAERFQTLAVRIFNLAQKRQVKSLLVTSALEGEGKTTIATGLAALMARPSDRNVLLVDSDMRRPSIARMLGVSLHQGWRDVLEGRSTAFHSIVRLEPIGLYLLAGYSTTSNSQRALPPNNLREAAEQLTARDSFASARPEELIRELERHFSLVVIDAPAILDFAESQRFASIADATLIVTRAGETHYSAVGDAVKLVPKDRRLGIVLNESSMNQETVRFTAKGKRGPFAFFKRRHQS